MKKTQHLWARVRHIYTHTHQPANRSRLNFRQILAAKKSSVKLQANCIRITPTAMVNFLLN